MFNMEWSIEEGNNKNMKFKQRQETLNMFDNLYKSNNLYTIKIIVNNLAIKNLFQINVIFDNFFN